ncbi:MAG: BON domain-containing protein [Alphaproteobacteria bacterium]|nr:BON domain-containing protein [Alphaproteobacteria bacterium]
MMFLRLLTIVTVACSVALPAAADPGRHAPKPRPEPSQTLVIRAGSGGPASRHLLLPLHKAAIIELPEDSRDVLVSSPDIVDAVVRTPRRIYVVGLKVGQSNAFFFNAGGKQLLNLEIVVERDLDALRNLIGRSIPGADVKAEMVNDNVILTGSVRSASDADAAKEIAIRYVTEANMALRKEAVVNRIAIRGGEQVMLRVRVAEMQRTLSKQLGVDISSAFNIGRSVPVTLDSVNPFSLLGQALSTSQQFKFGSLATGNSVEATVQALERTGLVRTLAQPNLTAISGESAKFLAGGEFPVPTSRDRDGNVQIEFKPFGVGLGFTPVVLSEGRISLHISTEVSEITGENAFVSQGGSFTDSNGNTLTVPGITIPGLRVRRAETTVELPSGGSMVMAGLLQQSMRQNIDGIPGLKNLPIIGALFQSRDYQNGETELVVIVTPYLVEPTSAENLQGPTDGFAPPTDAETVLLSRLNATYGPKDGKPQGSLKGPIGFIVQ